MGCCCFNTLRGAAFFVASVHIYNGLECMLKFIAFPMVYSAMTKDADTPFAAFLPGMVYAILYFILGCIIFRGIETEGIAHIKWGAVGFSVTEVVFFILRVGLGIIPTPTVPSLPKGDQPFEWNIYRTLNYFIFTIVGGLVYICILFLYLQKLSTGRDEFAQLTSFLNRGTTTTPSTPAPSTGGGGANPASGANATSASAANNPQNQQNPPSAQQNSSSRNTNNNKSSKPHPPPHKGEGESRKPRLAASMNPPQPLATNIAHPIKEPQSPGSPMFPYFLLRRNSKLSASQKSGGGGGHERMVEEPLGPAPWHQPRVQSVSMLNRQEYGEPPTPRSDAGGGGRLLSPSRLVNHHQQPPLPPPHQFQPMIPPFYTDSADEGQAPPPRSFIPPGFVSPTGSHYGPVAGGYVGRGGAESLYQKIPMSPGFDYCLR